MYLYFDVKCPFFSCMDQPSPFQLPVLFGFEIGTDGNPISW